MGSNRVIAQRVLTGEFLSWDVPLLGSTSRELSGPGGIFGTLNPADATRLAADGLPLLREWSTALYHEVDGEIRAAGIVAMLDENGDRLAVEAPGFSTYPHGIVHDGTHRFPVGANALDVVRYLWRHVQSFPDADLGVTVADTPCKEIVDIHKERTKKDGTTFVKIHGYRIPWWEFRDCGDEIDQMLDRAPADYIETHRWNGDHTKILHHIDLGVPRLGRKRGDLRFAEGENVIEAVPLRVDGDDFAQNVYAVGRGEGRKIRHHEVASRDDRLRRTAVVIDKEAHAGRVRRMAQREHRRRSEPRDFDQVVVRDHENARISDIHPGDDILVDATLDYHGRVRLWVRVSEIEQDITGEDVATLHVSRTDSHQN